MKSKRLCRARITLSAIGLGFTVALSGATGAARAQDAVSPDTLLSESGYPELRVTVTADGVDAPADVAAGRYLMSVAALGRGDVNVHLVQLPAGVTEAAAEAALAASGEEDVPAIVHEWDFAGGVFVPRGQTGQIVLDLTPGDWFIVGADPGGDAGMPAPEDLMRPLTVTANDGVLPEAPAVDATVELREFAFDGLPGGSDAGRQVWQVTNVGEQVHHVILAYYPDRIAVEQVRALAALGEEGTPPPDFGIDPERIEFEVGRVHVLSPGRTVWAELDLSRPGSYIALCFMPDPETGMDHVSLGMIGVFTVQ